MPPARGMDAVSTRRDAGWVGITTYVILTFAYCVFAGACNGRLGVLAALITSVLCFAIGWYGSPFYWENRRNRRGRRTAEKNLPKARARVNVTLSRKESGNR